MKIGAFCIDSEKDVWDALDCISYEAGGNPARIVDDEEARALERALWQGVLLAIAEGRAKDAPEMARLALLSRGVKFRRWFA